MSKNVKGLEKLISVLQKIPAEMDSKVEDILYVNGLDIAAEAKKLSPVDLGTLRQSIAASKVDKKTVKVMANATGLAPYAAHVEYGTKAHVIRSKNGKALKFKVGGKDVFATSVNHPGTKKQPFFFPAVFKGKARFIEDLEHLLKETFNKV